MFVTETSFEILLRKQILISDKKSKRSSDMFHKKLMLFITAILPCLLAGVYHHTGDYIQSGSVHMVMRDSLAYLSCRTEGLQVINVADPANPVLAGSLESGMQANCSALYGNYLVVPTTNSYLKVVDVTNPAQMSVVGNLQLALFGRVIGINGDFAYVASYDSLRIIDLQNPAQPVKIASLPIQYSYPKIALRDNLLYILGEGTVKLYNIADPFLPQLLSSISFTGGAVSMAWQNEYLYLGKEDGNILVYDVSNAALPVQIGQMTAGEMIDEIYVSGNKLYVAAGDQGMRVYQMLSPVTIEYESCYQCHLWMDNLIIRENLVFASVWKFGLLVIDCSNADFAPLINNIPTVDNVTGMVKNGSYLYISSNSRIFTYDVSIPENPILTDTYYTNGMSDIADLEMYENVLYAASQTHVRLFSLQDPAHPVSISTIDRSMRRIAFQDQLLYGIYNTNGLGIYGVSNPYLPQQLSECAIQGINQDFMVSGNHVYYTGGYLDSLFVINVSNPGLPVAGNAISMPVEVATGITRSGDLAAVSCDYQINLADISSPGNPVIINSMSFPHEPYPIVGQFIGNVMLVSLPRSNHILQYDLSDPLNPFLTDEMQWNLFTMQLHWDNGYLYTGNYTLGTSILDYSVTAVPDEPDTPTPYNDLNLKCYPNPFNPHTRISYELAKDEKVTLNVYNLKGQLVRQLKNEFQHKGKHEIGWNGLDNSGRSCSSGMYLIRLGTGSATSNLKAVLMK